MDIEYIGLWTDKDVITEYLKQRQRVQTIAVMTMAKNRPLDSAHAAMARLDVIESEIDNRNLRGIVQSAQ